MTDARKHNRPPPKPRALSDADVAVVDYLVHELGARQWKVGMKLGVSCVTIGHAVGRKGAYADVPKYVGNAEVSGLSDGPPGYLAGTETGEKQ